MPRNLTQILIAFALAAVAGCATVEPQPSGEPRAADPLAELHTQLGIGYLKEGKHELAWNRLQRALKLDPNYSAAHNAMGLLYEQLNEVEKSGEHYQRAVELNPSDARAQINYGNFLCRQGKVEEAEAHFLKAVANSLYQSPEVAHANAGLCLKVAGDLDKAETYLRRALTTDPKMPEPLLAMAEVSEDNGHHLSARGYLQRYLEVATHVPRSLWLGIRIERSLGDKNTAASYELLLKNKFPDSPETRKLLDGSGP